VRRWHSLGLATWLVVSVVSEVSAHAELVRSSPSADERLAVSPSTIALFFDEELDAQASRFVVVDVNGRPMAAVEGKVDLTDPEHARLVAEAVPALADGVYTVRWTALSTDGDDAVTEGEFDFIVGNAAPRAKPAATAAAASPLSVEAAPEAAVAASTAPGSAWLSLGIVGAVVVVLAIMAAALARAKR
jgi:methionine-rich copper-binding protein CopC